MQKSRRPWNWSSRHWVAPISYAELAIVISAGRVHLGLLVAGPNFLEAVNRLTAIVLVACKVVNRPRVCWNLVKGYYHNGWNHFLDYSLRFIVPAYHSSDSVRRSEHCFLRQALVHDFEELPRKQVGLGTLLLSLGHLRKSPEQSLIYVVSPTNFVDLSSLNCLIN